MNLRGGQQLLVWEKLELELEKSWRWSSRIILPTKVIGSPEFSLGFGFREVDPRVDFLTLTVDIDFDCLKNYGNVYPSLILHKTIKYFVCGSFASAWSEYFAGCEARFNPWRYSIEETKLRKQPKIE
ncbi:hypothetical protein K7X08_020678 [Anisodus acutangulus]|uniref:Uncharacterized protein n=1 Tax=Anisodus acutangulus TaxID=402998 RepID=A0A9Q1MTQ1_9SOLA|nr:hypothetical protein K7X08_020678 [Anisodus acutangulus]